MRPGLHLIDIPPEWGPDNGLSWSWRWVEANTDDARLGIALVWPRRTLLVLWRRTGALNTMRVEAR